MENLEKDEKKRERETNWSTCEKEFLRECINNHLSIVENKGNDTSIINKKKNAWKAINESMASAGFNRDISKLKSQWVRMKVNARKAVASVKRAGVATGNSVVIPELSAEDDLVQSMISHEFVDDEILIDSNSLNKLECMEMPISSEYLDCEILDGQSSDKDYHNKENENIIITTPEQYSYKTPKIKKATFSSKLKRLRNLPKTPSKNDIISERQRQIEKESLFSEEIKNLKKNQVSAEIEHMERMYKTQEIQQKEIHSLKLKQLQMQIDQDREIHALNVEVLRKKLST